ncbi:MAG: hypothetical protein LAT76_10750 [Schleiferiaceae bacterium]|nr:hypothetical protein [Schleiferiaceae bacterium]
MRQKYGIEISFEGVFKSGNLMGLCLAAWVNRLEEGIGIRRIPIGLDALTRLGLEQQTKAPAVGV